MKTTLVFKNCLYLLFGRSALLLVPLLLACFALSPSARAVCHTVRYDAVNAMLLNEFLKEHRKVETLQAKVAKLEATVEKVSAQLEQNKSAPQIVLNNP
jgi:hypothetical protein